MLIRAMEQAINNLQTKVGTTGSTDPTCLDFKTNGFTGTASDRALKCAVVAFTGGTDTGGGIFSWTNPESSSIIISKFEVDVTTIATGACTLSVGATASSGTTSSANLIDTLDVHTATGTFDNSTDKSTNGKSRQKLAAGKWVTGSTASGASAGLVGNLYIMYHLV